MNAEDYSYNNDSKSNDFSGFSTGTGVPLLCISDKSLKRAKEILNSVDECFLEGNKYILYIIRNSSKNNPSNYSYENI